MSPQPTPWIEIALVVGVVLAIPTGLLAGLYLYVRSFRRPSGSPERGAER